VNGADDLAVVDPAQVGGRDGEVRVSELSLDDQQRDPLAGELNGVPVSELVGREATPDSGYLGGAAQLPADQCWRAGGSAGRAVQHAEQRPDREGGAELEPGVELLLIPTSE
jgi:hypothetical protein